MVLPQTLLSLMATKPLDLNQRRQAYLSYSTPRKKKKIVTPNPAKARLNWGFQCLPSPSDRPARYENTIASSFTSKSYRPGNQSLKEQSLHQTSVQNITPDLSQTSSHKKLQKESQPVRILYHKLTPCWPRICSIVPPPTLHHILHKLLSSINGPSPHQISKVTSLRGLD